MVLATWAHVSDVSSDAPISVAFGFIGLKSSGRDYTRCDILRLRKDGVVEFLWRKGSASNCLFVTSKCNCECLMCPQPPAKDSEDFDAVIMRVLSLWTNMGKSHCITGGEPTLPRRRFLKILSVLKLNHNNR
jgi:hypothetical protein